MGARPDESDATRLLRAASSEYTDLPDPVGDRLDRVLDQLPAADTLHRAVNRRRPLTERLGLDRVRYGMVTAAAALVVTIGGVALAVQVVSGADGDGTGASTAADQPETMSEDAGAQAEDFSAEDEPATAPEDHGGGVATFTTGSDYNADSDVLAALRDLGGGTAAGAVPDELAPLAAGGPLWQACQDAIAARYDSLLVAADFARFDSEPAVVALLLTDSGEVAVAVTPDCADGEVEELFAQG